MGISSSLPIHHGALCCTGRRPPSPDALPARVVRSPSKLSKAPSPAKTAVPMSDNQDKQRVQSNVSFLAVPYDRVVSGNVPVMVGSKAEEAAKALLADNALREEEERELKEVHAIFEDKGSEEEFGEQGMGVKRKLKSKKSVATLGGVKERLKKAFSREVLRKDAGFKGDREMNEDDIKLKGRHKGRKSSIGTSEEEIERRRELKRLRERRIREELTEGGEEGWDEDAKSLGVGIEGVESIVVGRQREGKEMGDEIRGGPSAIDPRQLQEIKMTRSYSFGSSNGTVQKTRPCYDTLADSNVATNRNGTMRSRRYSSPEPFDFEADEGQPNVYHPRRKRSSLPPMPSAPVLCPQRLPSLSEPSVSSWRLSFTSERRGDHLRKLSREHKPPVSMPANFEPLTVGLQPMTNWLRSQGLRSPSQALSTDSDDAPQRGSQASRRHTRSTSDWVGGVDGTNSTLIPIPLHELNISQRLASRDLRSSTSSPELSSSELRHRRQISNQSNTSRFTYNTRARYMRNTSYSHALSDLIPPSWGNILNEQSSSIYPSGANSRKSSLQSSRFDLKALVADRMGRVDIEGEDPLEAYLALLHPPSKELIPLVQQQDPDVKIVSALAAATTKQAHHTKSFDDHGQTSAIDGSTLVLSQLNDHHEDGVTPQRYPSNRQNTPVSSRFREEFSPEDTPTRTPKTSRLSRLAKFAAKGQDADADLLPIPPHRAGYGYTFKETGTPIVPPARSSSVSRKGSYHTPTRSKLTAFRKFSHFGFDGVGDDLSPVKSSLDLVDNQVEVRQPETYIPTGAPIHSGSWSVGPFGETASIEAPTPVRSPTVVENATSVWERSFVHRNPVEKRGLASYVPNAWKKNRQILSPSRSAAGLSGASSPSRRSHISALSPLVVADTEGATSMWTRAMASSQDPKMKARKKAKKDANMFNHWEAQLENNQKAARDATKNTLRGKKAAKFPIRKEPFPESWCRYPSHTRDQRNLGAGPIERVNFHDYAIKSEDEETGEIQYIEHVPHQHFRLESPNDDPDSPVLYPRKPARVLRKGWYDWRTRSQLSLHETQIGTLGKRNSFSVARKVEYPELELLPMGLPMAEEVEVELAARMMSVAALGEEEREERVREARERREAEMKARRLKIGSARVEGKGRERRHGMGQIDNEEDGGDEQELEGVDEDLGELLLILGGSKRGKNTKLNGKGKKTMKTITGSRSTPAETTAATAIDEEIRNGTQKKAQEEMKLKRSDPRAGPSTKDRKKKWKGGRDLYAIDTDLDLDGDYDGAGEFEYSRGYAPLCDQLDGAGPAGPAGVGYESEDADGRKDRMGYGYGYGYEIAKEHKDKNRYSCGYGYRHGNGKEYENDKKQWEERMKEVEKEREREMERERERLSWESLTRMIADPRFYDDCIVRWVESDNDEV